MEIDGKKLAREIISGLKKQPKPQKYLAVIIFGEDKKSFGFVTKKEIIAKELGVDFRVYRLPADLNSDKARKEVLKIAQHKTCGGVLVQLPLPENLNKHYIVNVIPREKDVDVLGERALGAFYNDRNPVLPPAVEVVRRIILDSKFDIQNSTVAVVGAGFLTGKPITAWLTGKAKEVFVLDEGSDLNALESADIIISGVGKPGLIKPEMLRDGAGVIDFGYAEVQTEADGLQIVGDLDTERIKASGKQLVFYTPTPGGTGPVLVAQLFLNFYKLNSTD